jgi:hypothetical protein
VWAGVDSVWEQENAEARKMLENGEVSQPFILLIIDGPACPFARSKFATYTLRPITVMMSPMLMPIVLSHKLVF